MYKYLNVLNHRKYCKYSNVRIFACLDLIFQYKLLYVIMLYWFTNPNIYLSNHAIYLIYKFKNQQFKNWMENCFQVQWLIEQQHMHQNPHNRERWWQNYYTKNALTCSTQKSPNVHTSQAQDFSSECENQRKEIL